MTVNKNKEIVRFLYEQILNNRKFEKFDSIVSSGYINAQGETGIEAFKKGMLPFLKAFPDARWELTEMIAENDKVAVKQTVTGTHQRQFQTIEPTGRSVTIESHAIYIVKDGKITGHQIQTDRLGFMQQLGVIPRDLPAFQQGYESNVYFVDRFFIPANAVTEFLPRMEYNWDFIKPLPGFIEHKVIVDGDPGGDMTLMTIAIWKNQEYLDKAKFSVQNEYRSINFNPQEFMQKLNIKMERQVYHAYISSRTEAADTIQN